MPDLDEQSFRGVEKRLGGGSAERARAGLGGGFHLLVNRLRHMTNTPAERCQDLHACQFTALEGSCLGHAGVRKFLADLAEVAADAHVENVDYRDLGDRVLALGDARATAVGSRIPMDGTLAAVATFVDGRMTAYEDFGDRDTALRAAGVEEWKAAQPSGFPRAMQVMKTAIAHAP